MITTLTMHLKSNWSSSRAIWCCLILTASLLFVDCARRHFVTVDEAAHLTAGIAYWERADYRLYSVNPPLTRFFSSLPVMPLPLQTDSIASSLRPNERLEFTSGAAFALDNAERYQHIVFRARLVGLAWLLFGGWLIAHWSSKLYGPGAAWIGVPLWCFGPNILGHGSLITPDIPAAVAALGATYTFWLYVQKPSWSRAILVGCCLGLAQLTKFTLLVLYPAWALLWLWFCLHLRHSVGLSLRSALAQILTIVLLSLLVINMGYEFQGTGRPLGKFDFTSQSFQGDTHDHELGNRFRDTWLGAFPMPLPAEYLQGIDVQRRDFERVPLRSGSYLAGEWRSQGWWYYYLYGLVVKVPLGAWLLFLLALTLTLSGHPARARWFDECFLLLPVLLLILLVSSQTGMNHHVRYIFPILGLLTIFTSKAGYFLQRTRWQVGALVLILLAWSVGSVVRHHPHHLSYFNELAGGPLQGHHHLVDSNIDWGQDVLHLKTWLDQHPEATPLSMACFTSVDPRIAGIDYKLAPFGPTPLPPEGPEAFLSGPQPGYHAISINYLRGVSTAAAFDEKGQRVSVPRGAYDYFRSLEPVARAGYSIYIYHLTRDQANQLRAEYGFPPLPNDKKKQ